MTEKIRELLTEIYGAKAGESAATRIESLLREYGDKLKRPASFSGDIEPGRIPLDQTDSMMITYGDQFLGDAMSPLAYLLRFLQEDLEATVGGVHILPFFPYSSDDGFSIIDYRAVNPDLGTWTDIEAISEEFRLMVDLVLNHCSKESNWFEAFKKGEEPYRRYFITVEPETDLSDIVRPRALPAVHEYDTREGKKLVWTTFSEDQVDLNFAEPAVLEEMLDVFLGFVERGVQIVRLDAIAYLWKEIGTPSIHHRKTHAVVRLFRAVVEEIAPWVVIITETNVPHQENVSYFGPHHDEAQMVYQFPLPPLVLDAFLREDVGHLRDWAEGLPPVQPDITFLNFLASHDGIGLLPAHGILSEEEIKGMISKVRERDGLISYKSTAKGDIPYEMNVNYLDAIAEQALPDEQRARKFLASQSIMLAMAGVPGIYVHSLIGSTNWIEGVRKTGQNRTINREKLPYDELAQELAQEGSLRNLVFTGFKELLRLRAAEPAFHPSAEQKVIDCGPAIFGVLRTARSEDADDEPHVFCLHNVSHDPVECVIDRAEAELGDARTVKNLVGPEVIFPHNEGAGKISVELEAHEVMWLKY